MNIQMLIGNLAADPEKIETENGTIITKFRVITNENWTDKSGTKQERSDGHRVVCFARLAEICEQYLSKGRKVYVLGRTQHDRVEGKDGTVKYFTDVIAKEVEFLGSNGTANKPSEDADVSDPALFDPSDFDDI